VLRSLFVGVAVERLKAPVSSYLFWKHWCKNGIAPHEGKLGRAID
jgi:hypothetical protein